MLEFIIHFVLDIYLSLISNFLGTHSRMKFSNFYPSVYFSYSFHASNRSLNVTLKYEAEANSCITIFIIINGYTYFFILFTHQELMKPLFQFVIFSFFPLHIMIILGCSTCHNILQLLNLKCIHLKKQACFRNPKQFTFISPQMNIH